MNNKHNMQSYMIPIVTILIVDNMGYYGILWDNSLAKFIKKEETRNEFLVALKNIAIMKIRSTFVHFCPYSESKDRILHDAFAVHPPFLSLLSKMVMFMERRELRLFIHLGHIKHFARKILGYQDIHHTDTYMTGSRADVHRPLSSFDSLIPRCRTRGFGGSPWTFLLTVSCWSPRLFCPESGGIPHGIHPWKSCIILDPWVLLGMGLYWHTRHIDCWWPNWTLIVTIDTAMNTEMDILGDCLWYLVIIYMILYPWILATQYEWRLPIWPFFLEATHWYSSSSSRNETSEETWA